MEQEITWHTVLDYAPMSNGKAECMVGTMKRSVATMGLNGSSDWEEALRTASYGYRMRAGKGKRTPYELLYGVSSEDEIIGEWGSIDTSDREIELMALEHQCAMPIDTPTNPNAAAIFHPADEVLVFKGAPIGRLSKNPPFDTKLYGP